jgi:hypothetical protein
VVVVSAVLTFASLSFGVVTGTRYTLHIGSLAVLVSMWLICLDRGELENRRRRTDHE